MRIRNVAAVLAAVMLVGGCSDSATNDAPEVGPTDPTSGNGAPPPPPAGVGSFKALFVAGGGISDRSDVVENEAHSFDGQLDAVADLGGQPGRRGETERQPGGTEGVAAGVSAAGVSAGRTVAAARGEREQERERECLVSAHPPRSPGRERSLSLLRRRSPASRLPYAGW